MNINRICSDLKDSKSEILIVLLKNGRPDEMILHCALLYSNPVQLAAG